MMQVLVQAVAATAHSVTTLSESLRAGGTGGNRSREDDGYRVLKPKKDLQRITAADAKMLMTRSPTSKWT